jgi:hypothetical protein
MKNNFGAENKISWKKRKTFFKKSVHNLITGSNNEVIARVVKKPISSYRLNMSSSLSSSYY